MKCLIPLALGVVLAVPATAQVSGANRNAPVVTTSIVFPNKAKIEVSYAAIHFGQGMWQAIKDDEQAIEQFNDSAKSAPIGSVETSIAVRVSGREVAAGKYAMYFTYNTEFGSWILNLAKEGSDLIQWGLRLEESEKKHARMFISLAAGDKSDNAEFTVAFGNQYVTVPVTPVVEKEGEK